MGLLSFNSQKTQPSLLWRRLLTLGLVCSVWIANAQEVVVFDQQYDSENNLVFEKQQAKGSDTIYWISYHPNGLVSTKMPRVHGKRNGLAYIYNRSGNPQFITPYKNDHREGRLMFYEPDGTLGYFQDYHKGLVIGTEVYFRKTDTIKTVRHRVPCDIWSNQCNSVTTVYNENQKVYSYLTLNGQDANEHTVINQELYEKYGYASLLQVSRKTGLVIYKQNCAPCHRLDKRLVGPPLGCFVRDHGKEELDSKTRGEGGHVNNKLTAERLNALIEYLESECD